MVVPANDDRERSALNGEIAEASIGDDLKAARECVLDAYVRLDEHGLIVKASPALEALLGYTSPSLTGMNWTAMIHADDHAAMSEALDRARQEPKAMTDVRGLRRDGTHCRVRMVCARILPNIPEFLGHYCFLEDLSSVAKKEDEQRALQTRLLLADRMISVGTLSSGVAHEINNPLSYVTANLRYIADELTEVLAGNTAERVREVRDALEEAREGAERIRRIVRDLRTFSSGDHEGRGLLDVHAVLDSALTMCLNDVRHRGRLVKDYARVPMVDANEARLAQMFLNLVVNALQSIPEGRADQNEIRIVTRTDESKSVIIEVHDTGSGMPAEVIDRIFDPFFTTKPVGVGTGLGLSICLRIVTDLGGHIQVESRVGVGSTIRVILPNAQDSKTGKQRQNGSESTGRARVLVIDDEPMVGIAIRRTLAPDHDVQVAASGAQALALYAEHARFDVILCDVMMPNLTGIDVYESVGKIAPDQRRGFVFLAGGSLSRENRDYLSKLPNLCLEKPFEVHVLRRVVRDVIRNGAGQRVSEG